MSTMTSRQPFAVFWSSGEDQLDGSSMIGREAHFKDMDRQRIEELVRDDDRELVVC